MISGLSYFIFKWHHKDCCEQFNSFGEIFYGSLLCLVKGWLVVIFLTMKYHRAFNAYSKSIVIFLSFFLKTSPKIDNIFHLPVAIVHEYKTCASCSLPKSKEEKQGERRIQIIPGLLCLSKKKKTVLLKISIYMSQ